MDRKFRGWQQTVHLLSSPKNAERLMEAVRQIEAGQTQERALIVPGASPGNTGWSTRFRVSRAPIDAWWSPLAGFTTDPRLAAPDTSV